MAQTTNILFQERDSAIKLAESNRYPALKTIENIIRGVGYVALFIALIAIITAISNGNSFLDIIMAPFALAPILVALLLIGYAEIIQVVLDIEHNTRRTYIDQYYLYNVKNSVSTDTSSVPTIQS